VPVLLGLLGVLGFSFTLPLTRVAVEGLDPAFVGLGRAAVAALPAALLLVVWREACPTGPRCAGWRWSRWAWYSASRCCPRWRCAS
jgi:drug/metabolite transporter (DMT)-like permease